MTFVDLLIGRAADPLAWWQMSIRAAVVFVYAVALYRLLPRRALGGSAVIDVVLAIIVSSSLSRAMTGNAPLPETMAAVSVMAGLYYAMTVLARRSDGFASLVKGRPIVLVRDGRIDPAGLRTAQFGRVDLDQHLRHSGVASVGDVRQAQVERDGSVSVLMSDD
jgi:uncharacterized membrane protein YcaP (DUF421 family)